VISTGGGVWKFLVNETDPDFVKIIDYRFQFMNMAIDSDGSLYGGISGNVAKFYDCLTNN